MLSIAFYCASEGLVYAKIYSNEQFLVSSTAFIGVFLVSTYIWLRTLTQKLKVRKKDLLWYVFSIPGIVFSVQTYLLPVAVKKEVYKSYLYGFNYARMSEVVKVNNIDSLPVYLSGGMHAFIIVAFLFVTARLVYKNKLSKDSDNEDVLLRTIYIGFSSLIVNAILALAVPVLFKLEGVSGYNPLFTLPISGIFFMLVRQKQLLIERAVEHRSMMSKYLPRELVNKVLNEDTETEEGSKNEAIILFCDIRRFTELSESMLPEDIVRLLNSYFAVMNRVIQRHGGIISKYMGDAIMVVFSDDDDLSTMYDRSSLCALDMMKALGSFNERAEENGAIPLEIGIAIHSGEMIHGSVGCSTRMEYTVIGDTVNTAARIANLNSELKRPILCSEDYIKMILSKPDNIHLEGEWVFKGKSEAISVYSFGRFLENGYERDESMNISA